MNIRKSKRKATIRGGDGWKLDVHFFLRQQAEEHSGRELIIDLLNSKAGFIACDDYLTKEILFVNKSRIMCLELEGQDLLEETLLSPAISVRLELTNGEVLEGVFLVELPPERSRLSDYLNFTPQFLYLCREEGDLILNKSYVLSAREKGDLTDG